MKLGYSLLLRQLLAAEELNYDDCKSFQIVCPACHEAIFKVGSQEGERNHLSHYASSRSVLPDCELRVAATSSTEIAAGNATSRMQHLVRFQKVFREAALESLWPDQQPRRLAAKQIDAMMKRASYRALVRIIRSFISDMEAGSGQDHTWSKVDSAYAHRSPFWRARQVEFGRDFLKHLIAPNSFDAISFAISAGLMVQSEIAVDAEPSDRQQAEVFQITQELICMSDRELKKRLLDVEGRGCLSHPEPNGYLAMIGATATLGVINVLVEFPYLDVIRNATRERSADPA